MKVFVSWSGARSRMAAEALTDWLPKVIQAVEPFYSPDMEKGAQWSTQIDAALEGTSFGVVCLTPENLDSRWIHFEAGALSKIPDSRVWTFLVGLRPGDVPQPLGKFQATVAQKVDVRKLLEAINQQLPVPLTTAVLDDAFEVRWPALESKLIEAATSPSKSARRHARDTNSMLEELLTLVRAQERRVEVPQAREIPVVGGHVVQIEGSPERVRMFVQRMKEIDGVSAAMANFSVDDRHSVIITHALKTDEFTMVVERLAREAGVVLPNFKLRKSDSSNGG